MKKKLKKTDGLLSQMEASTVNYTKLTKEILLETFESLVNIKPPKQERGFVMYTGWKGYNNYNFTLKFGASFRSWWLNHFKHKELLKYDTYVSVVRKHSLYKVKVVVENEEYKFILLKGTKMIAFFNNINALNTEIKKLEKEADMHDAKREHERKLKIAKRELEGKLRLIENEYED